MKALEIELNDTVVIRLEGGVNCEEDGAGWHRCHAVVRGKGKGEGDEPALTSQLYSGGRS